MLQLKEHIYSLKICDRSRSIILSDLFVVQLKRNFKMNELIFGNNWAEFAQGNFDKIKIELNQMIKERDIAIQLAEAAELKYQEHQEEAEKHLEEGYREAYEQIRNSMNQEQQTKEDLNIALKEIEKLKKINGHLCNAQMGITPSYAESLFKNFEQRENVLKKELDKEKFNLESVYFVFRESMACVACGLKGTKMFLECHKSDKSPHFNLYGEEDGSLILFTKDHIHARAFGGGDFHHNYQVMCLICNNLKGHANLALDDVRELRTLYNQNKNKTTKKKLHLMIEGAKNRMARPWPEQQKKKVKGSLDAMLVAYDMNIYKVGEDFVGKSVYDDREGIHVGCIRRGTLLEPLAVQNTQVLCQIDKNNVVMMHKSLLREIA